jgi:tetratricopeptide (TPR) repeat protein
MNRARHFRPFPDLVLVGILAVAAGIRWRYFLEVRDTLLFRVPFLDSWDYHTWALRLVGGDWGRGEPYWLGPLYPHALALTYAVFGVQGSAAQLLQLGANLLAVYLVYRLASRVADPTVGLVAAALYGFYGTPVFYAGLLLMATLLTLLLLLISGQLMRALARPTGGRWLALGALIGLTALARGNVLFLLLAIPPLLWREPLTTPLRLRLSGILIAGAFAVVAPVTLRNLVVGGDVVPITSNAGINLLIGQQARHGGIFGPTDELPQLEFDPTGASRLQDELGRELAPSEVSRIYTGRAVRLLLSRPGVMIPHYARKAYRFWSGYELPQIVAYEFWRARLPALRLLAVPFVLLVAAGLPGIGVLRGRARAVLAVMILGYFVSLWPFFPTARYRLPIAPLLAVTAAVFCVAMLRRLRAPQTAAAVRLRAVAPWLAAAAALAIVLLPRWSALPPEQVAWKCHLNEASRAAEVGDRTTLLAEARTAEQLRPGLAETPYRLAGYLQELGDDAGALVALEMAERRAPGDRLIPYRIGRNLEDLGRLDEAVTAFDRAAALDPDWAHPHYAKGLVLRKQNDLRGAVAAMAAAVRREPGRAQFRGNLGSLLAENGDLAGAREVLKQLTTDYPAYLNGWFNLALVEYQAGNLTAARRAADRAAALPRLRPAEKDRLRQLQSLLRRSAPR